MLILITKFSARTQGLNFFLPKTDTLFRNHSQAQDLSVFLYVFFYYFIYFYLGIMIYNTSNNRNSNLQYSNIIPIIRVFMSLGLKVPSQESQILLSWSVFCRSTQDPSLLAICYSHTMFLYIPHIFHNLYLSFSCLISLLLRWQKFPLHFWYVCQKSWAECEIT